MTIENDAKYAALAELWQSNLKGVKNALVLVVGMRLGMCYSSGKAYIQKVYMDMQGILTSLY